MTNFPTCPHCGGELIPISYDDFDAESGYITVTIYGECDTCHKNFSWGEEYEFTAAYDITEEED
jgi:uncharacterized protein with PIN domain